MEVTVFDDAEHLQALLWPGRRGSLGIATFRAETALLCAHGPALEAAACATGPPLSRSRA
jgi:hypothetical protein